LTRAEPVEVYVAQRDVEPVTIDVNPAKLGVDKPRPRRREAAPVRVLGQIHPGARPDVAATWRGGRWTSTRPLTGPAVVALAFTVNLPLSRRHSLSGQPCGSG
jgi:hypothetical protein